MIIKPILYFSLFLCATKCYINAEQHENALEYTQKADQLFEATLYAEAALAYEELYHDHFSVELKQRLAYSYFMMHDYTKAIAVLNREPLSEENCYLMGICYNRMGNYTHALEALLKYTALPNLKHSNFAEFECGFAYFALGSYQQAANCFAKVTKKSDQVSIFHLSQIYLARTKFKESKYSQGYTLLETLFNQGDLDPILKMEAYFVFGEAKLENDSFSDAVIYLEKSLPLQNQEKTAWYSENLYLLGVSCQKAAELEKNPTAQKAELLSKSERYLQCLLDSERSDRARLSLGACYLLQAKTFNEMKYYQHATALLENSEYFENQDNFFQGLLMLAQNTPSYEQRDQWYRLLTTNISPQHTIYMQGWVLRAVNDLNEAEKLKDASRAESEQALERTISSCKKAQKGLNSSNKLWEALAIKVQAQAYFASETRDGLLQALTLLEEMTVTRPQLLAVLEAPDEVWYLRSLVTCQLALEDPAYYDKTFKIVEEQIKRYPDGKFSPDAAILLGTLAYQYEDYKKAEECFLNVVKNYENSASIASDALYWAALSADACTGDKEKGRHLRTELFEKYPNSPRAAEAYFTYYSFDEYVQGNRSAIKHLNSFTEKYPYSPQVISAHVLLGLDFLRDRKTPEGKWIRRKNFNSAIASFQSAQEQFDIIYQMELISAEQLPFYINIRYRAMIESALANHKISESSEGAKRQIYLEYAEKVLKSMIDEFKSPENEFAKQLLENSSLQALNEEASYLLAATYSKEGKDAQARDLLEEIFKQYQNAKITRGYFLSKSLYEKGVLAMKSKNYPVALDFFKQSEEAAKGDLLTVDELLDIWIKQSNCYRENNQLEQAMLILSQVINYDAVSSLRMQAMYLRAEIYELQKRFELARKQLEATAKKGGEWGTKAKEKLGNNYVYQ